MHFGTALQPPLPHRAFSLGLFISADMPVSILPPKLPEQRSCLFTNSSM